jgi:hypothetical protein
MEGRVKSLLECHQLGSGMMGHQTFQTLVHLPQTCCQDETSQTKRRTPFE